MPDCTLEPDPFGEDESPMNTRFVSFTIWRTPDCLWCIIPLKAQNTDGRNANQ
jgi:hypothetical protein